MSSHEVTLIRSAPRTVGRVRRGGSLSIIWKGDHSPRHVHVFRDGRLDLLLHQLTVEAVRRAEERKTVDRILELLQVLDAEELRVE